MTVDHALEGRAGASHRRGPRPVTGRVLALLVAAGTLAGCTGPGAGADAPAAATARSGPTGTGVVTQTPSVTPAGAPHAGHYPVATPQPQVTSTPSVTEGGYELVSAGDPVRVHLGGADVVVQVSGPDVTLPAPTPGEPVTAESAPGVLTVSFSPVSGDLPVRSADFLGLDEEQQPIDLAPDAEGQTVAPGHPVTLHLSSVFASGHTTLTWQPEGSPLVTWDFVVEID